MDLNNPTVHYEPKDISERGVMLGITGVFVTMCVLIGLLYFLFAHYANKKAAEFPTATPMMHAYGRQLPPTPRLQENPQEDLSNYQAAEAKELDGYRWIDRQSGRVAIPIDRAIDLTAQRGIGPAPAAQPNTYSIPEQGDPDTGFGMRNQAVSR